MNKAKTFNKLFTILAYSTGKSNRHIDSKIKRIFTNKILLTTTQVRLALLNNTNNNFTGPDSTNIRPQTHRAS